MTMRAIVQPVIMSGGAGTRLWPMSRASRPKQFLPLMSGDTLFQETVLRFSGAGDVDFLPPLVIAGARHAAIVASQLRAIGVEPAEIIIEPCPRNTAAVAAVAGAWTADHQPDALVLLAPADHHVADASSFRGAVASGTAAASRGAIVTFGIRPTEAHMGYGYVEAGAALGPSVAEVSAFREKPDRQTAEHFLRSGRHFWNAGVFLYAPETLAAELHAHAPKIRIEAAGALAAARREGQTLVLDASRFAACPSDSIDYAVMEKTKRAVVVAPVNAGWSDIGAWTALPPSIDPRIIAIDCEGAVIRTDGPVIGAVGAGDLIIIATDDAVLVAPKSRAQDVKRIVEELKTRKREDLL